MGRRKEFLSSLGPQIAREYGPDQKLYWVTVLALLASCTTACVVLAEVFAILFSVRRLLRQSENSLQTLPPSTELLFKSSDFLLSLAILLLSCVAIGVFYSARMRRLKSFEVPEFLRSTLAEKLPAVSKAVTIHRRAEAGDTCMLPNKLVLSISAYRVLNTEAADRTAFSEDAEALHRARYANLQRTVFHELYHWAIGEDRGYFLCNGLGFVVGIQAGLFALLVATLNLPSRDVLVAAIYVFFVGIPLAITFRLGLTPFHKYLELRADAFAQSAIGGDVELPADGAAPSDKTYELEKDPAFGRSYPSEEERLTYAAEPGKVGTLHLAVSWAMLTLIWALVASALADQVVSSALAPLIVRVMLIVIFVLLGFLAGGAIARSLGTQLDGRHWAAVLAGLLGPAVVGMAVLWCQGRSFDGQSAVTLCMLLAAGCAVFGRSTLRLIGLRAAPSGPLSMGAMPVKRSPAEPERGRRSILWFVLQKLAGLSYHTGRYGARVVCFLVALAVAASLLDPLPGASGVNWIAMLVALMPVAVFALSGFWSERGWTLALELPIGVLILLAVLYVMGLAMAWFSINVPESQTSGLDLMRLGFEMMNGSQSGILDQDLREAGIENFRKSIPVPLFLILLFYALRYMGMRAQRRQGHENHSRGSGNE